MFYINRFIALTTYFQKSLTLNELFIDCTSYFFDEEIEITVSIVINSLFVYTGFTMKEFTVSQIDTN